MYMYICTYTTFFFFFQIDLPFDESNTTLLFQKICTADFHYPSTFGSDIIDLLNLIFQIDPEKRATLETIQRHSWKLTQEEHDNPLAEDEQVYMHSAAGLGDEVITPLSLNQHSLDDSYGRGVGRDEEGAHDDNDDDNDDENNEEEEEEEEENREEEQEADEEGGDIIIEEEEEDGSDSESVTLSLSQLSRFHNSRQISTHNSAVKPLHSQSAKKPAPLQILEEDEKEKEKEREKEKARVDVSNVVGGTPISTSTTSANKHTLPKRSSLRVHISEVKRAQSTVHEDSKDVISDSPSKGTTSTSSHMQTKPILLHAYIYI
ncbi:hypothetical protein RFI_05027 [Reticulomyxa filosa]|uniref:non-specific serine/threonine protein kinase n=1 Tax=Reticulomyxa filosa TaxID=46433 RepID=X6P1S8_RETFI|nr:hypothetical protein RFI_05027 [Reticulomyxa filosa]|eukprot:ETO32093.1 hypothetical protein RFI_05027 [Reticulomyxa filosa]